MSQHQIGRAEEWCGLHRTLLTSIVPLIGVLNRLGVRYVVGGSLASSFWGQSRPASNVDVVLALHAPHVRPFCGALAATFSSCDNPDFLEGGLRNGQVSGFTHLETLTRVNLHAAAGSEFIESELTRAHALQLTESLGIVRLTTAEDVLLHKLVWYREGRHRSSRQWPDALGLFRARAGSLDQAYLDRWAWHLNVNDLLARVRSEAAP